jgi:ER-bound oxygenase mpaB/B'/Rubber oxygenase, catalytic domain
LTRWLDEIRRLDPERDHQRIVYLDVCFEFPFDTTRALEFALYRTYAVPSIGRLLAETGELTERPQKRYDDTDLILSTICESGYDSPEGRAALRQMNRIHGRFEISNEDFLYVLSAVTFEPVRWNERFGWRRLIDVEREATFRFWCEVGRRMAIRDIPPTYEEFERFNVDYEREHFRPTPEGRAVGVATRNLFLSWFRIPPRLGASFVHALMDEQLLRAMGFPPPPRLVRGAVEAALRARAKLVATLPPRRRPKIRTTRRLRSYPSGYAIDQLGPEAL